VEEVLYSIEVRKLREKLKSDHYSTVLDHLGEVDRNPERLVLTLREDEHSMLQKLLERYEQAGEMEKEEITKQLAEVLKKGIIKGGTEYILSEEGGESIEGETIELPTETLPVHKVGIAEILRNLNKRHGDNLLQVLTQRDSKAKNAILSLSKEEYTEIQNFLRKYAMAKPEERERIFRDLTKRLEEHIQRNVSEYIVSE